MQIIPGNQFYRVAEGDNMVQIAIKAGFRNWLTIYNHENNLEFRYDNPNPYALEVGTQLWIPERIPKEEIANTGKAYQFLAQAVASEVGLVLDIDEEKEFSVITETTGESLDLRHDVQVIPQVEGISTWGVGIAMLFAWRDEVIVDLSAITHATGYWKPYAEILKLEDISMFSRLGMKIEPVRKYTIEEFEQLQFQAYGPLWVTYGQPQANTPVRIITGMAGDGTPEGTQVYINDINNTSSNRDETYSETYQEFMREEIFVAYFPETETE
jgi:hypothetical protein